MYLIGNGTLFTNGSAGLLDDSYAVAVEARRVSEIGRLTELKRKYPEADYIDAEGGLIMPGLIDMSAQSRRKLTKSVTPPSLGPEEAHRLNKSRRFREDNALAMEHCVSAAYLSAFDCIKHGVTAICDIHRSPKCIPGSLQMLASVYRESGIRAIIGYSVSAGAVDAAITENAEFAVFCDSLGLNSVKAAFALDCLAGDESVIKVLGARGDRPLFIGFPENRLDLYDSLREYGMKPSERFAALGALGENTLVSGGAFIDRMDAETVNSRGAGYILTPLAGRGFGDPGGSGAFGSVKRLGLGSASLSGDMFAVVRAAANSTTPEPGSDMTPCADALLLGNAAIASRIFGAALGSIEPGNEADIAVFDCNFPYLPDGAAVKNIILNTLSAANCTMTMCAGSVLMRNGRLVNYNRSAINKKLGESIKNYLEKLVD